MAVAAALAIAALAATAAPAAAADLQPRVQVLPAEGAAPASMPKLGAEVADALARGAARTTSHVARADANLTDTAVIVGCDPEQHACLDAVAAALNVDQVVFARLKAQDSDAAVEVTAVTRDAEPSTRSFTVKASSRTADLAAVESAVVDMLESGEARRSQAHRDSGGGSHPLPPAAPPPLPPPTESGHARWPLFVAAGGAVLLGGGAACWALASSKQSDIDGAPSATAADLERLAGIESSAKGYATAGNLLVAGGAVVAIAGGILWWRSSSDGAAVTVTPAVGADHAAVLVEGRW
jgi:hypothetical protein